jgi:hypothetical protein
MGTSGIGMKNTAAPFKSPIRAMRAVFHYDDAISPDQRYLVYINPVAPLSNTREIHLARMDGTKDVVFQVGYVPEVMGWAPDGVHFIYSTRRFSPWLGSLCGASTRLTDTDQAGSIEWVDSQRFLFVTNGDGDVGELRLGRVGGPSIMIGNYNAPFARYEFNREPEATGF